MKKNIILNTDSYKSSHYLQYPPGTRHISSYIESRGGAYPTTLFFGLQMFLPELKAPTRKQVSAAEKLFTAHGFKFNREGWDYISNLGYLPLKIQAIREGTILPTGNVLVQVTNTDAKVPWLTSYIETALLRAIWYPTTVATRSKFIKSIIQDSIKRTSDVPEQIAFKLHDFGFRGVSSWESGAIGGLAHLVNFMGTDTVAALEYASEFYSESMAGFSIPAAEHSTITAWGKDKETEAYRNMLTKFPDGLVAVVSDSYDVFKACEDIWGGTLAEDVRTRNGVLVVRPDSGDPTVVPVEVIECLAEKFKTITNSKGFKVLPDFIRVIQGDGVNENSIRECIANLETAGFAIDNLAFGMGGELLQTENRDTLKFAMKASAIKANDGYWDNVFKSPVTDISKASKKGRLALINRHGKFHTVSELEANGSNLLETVFENGKILRHQTLADIRARTNG